ncbi:MBL fold metallo-hydrolase [Devosia pacifica]|uniref:MBL fold metallo-hydrolase n=1 Tax=Devosia pacifica TaxID=1335967 RepID=A0A918RWG9_9HYPH|nr:MBL fold metallo-hydrolase [Devosia pacifica]GHA13700.1 MBL fold metallo-hydrolase [Devosia pacifica]
MSVQLGSTMKVLRPYPNVLAFYDGRIPGVRAHSEGPNWLDDGAFTLGTASYAIVDGSEALVYDTHMSIAHAQIVRETLERLGVERMTVVLSHWHTDHVAGNAVFSDCEIIANTFTEQALKANRDALEGGDPPINPLIMPNRIFETEMTLQIGGLTVELRHLDIHSFDETVLYMPEHDVVFAGDTLEDTVTYVSEPDRLDAHLVDLERFAGWSFNKILPNHGSVERIQAGGYDRNFIEATRIYVEKLLQLEAHPDLAQQDLQTFAAEALATGGVEYFEAYEAVHQSNVKSVLEAGRKRA